MNLADKANAIRKDVIRVAVKNKAGHIAPSLSCVDILVALYYAVMKPNDKFILSKGHGCYALYAILADLGRMPKEEWENFYTPKSTLAGCIERRPEYGIEASCGALGHGLPIAVGIAYGAKLQGKSFHTYCLVGDGEMQEGSMWEALQFAVYHKLDNLTIVVDANELQAVDKITNILDKHNDSLFNRIKGFGCIPWTCDGHDLSDLYFSFNDLCWRFKKEPMIVYARTTKGYGLLCAENVPKFHFRIPTEEELNQ